MAVPTGVVGKYSYRCTVHKCINTSANKSIQSLRFFKFPMDDRSEEWARRIDRLDLLKKTKQQRHNSYRVCSMHFNPADLLKRRISGNALPFVTPYQLKNGFNYDDYSNISTIVNLKEDLTLAADYEVEAVIRARSATIPALLDHVSTFIEDDCNLESDSDIYVIPQNSTDHSYALPPITDTSLIGEQSLPEKKIGDESLKDTSRCTRKCFQTVKKLRLARRKAKCLQRQLGTCRAKVVRLKAANKIPPPITKEYALEILADYLPADTVSLLKCAVNNANIHPTRRRYSPTDRDRALALYSTGKKSYLDWQKLFLLPHPGNLRKWLAKEPCTLISTQSKANEIEIT